MLTTPVVFYSFCSTCVSMAVHTDRWATSTVRLPTIRSFMAYSNLSTRYSAESRKELQRGIREVSCDGHIPLSICSEAMRLHGESLRIRSPQAQKCPIYSPNRIHNWFHEWY